MKKILVVFTGGTIGSKKENKTIDVDSNTSNLLIDMYQKANRKHDIIFDITQPLNILSENLVSQDWLKLYYALHDINYLESYDGIVITHGTDTLAYTAAAVSYMFNDTKIPIVITASNYPLAHQLSNGLRNFENSIEFIINSHQKGIFVIFENNNGESIVYLGTRLVQSLHYLNEFDLYSPLNYGKLIDGKFQHNELIDLKENINKIHFKDISFSSQILFIKPHPNINYELFNFNFNKPKAIIHELYHSETACTRDISEFSSSLSNFIEKCQIQGIDFYITPFRSDKSDKYMSTNVLLQSGAIPLNDMLLEPALVKVLLAYGLFKEKSVIYHFINNTLYFEHIPWNDLVN